MPPRKLIPPPSKWLMVADSGCAPPPIAPFSACARPACACPHRAEPQCSGECRLYRAHCRATSNHCSILPSTICELAGNGCFLSRRCSSQSHGLGSQGYRVDPRSIPVIPVLACLLLSGLLGRSQRDGRPAHGMLPGRPAVPSFDQVAIAHVEEQFRARPFDRNELGANSGCGCMPLAIISPLASSAINVCHAATAASHACCMEAKLPMPDMAQASPASPIDRLPAHPATT